MLRHLKLNAELKKHKAGEIIRIECCDQGIPLDQYWRNRLKDAEKDNCCEFVEEKQTKKTKKVEE